jgi:hypothetical protein
MLDELLGSALAVPRVYSVELDERPSEYEFRVVVWADLGWWWRKRRREVVRARVYAAVMRRKPAHLRCSKVEVRSTPPWVH